MEKITGLPMHVAFIMDGNGRWAEERELPRLEGHRAGMESLRKVISCLDKRGVKYATVYAFSTENWNRPEEEVSGLLDLLKESIDTEAQSLHKNGVRIRHVGRVEGLPPGLQASIAQSVELTKNNAGMTLGIAFNYGGRLEIVDAVRRLIADAVPLQDINEELFKNYLYTAGFPEVDLVIRTGGEIRTSNFLIWQAAYAEYYYTPVLWPDFGEEELDKALAVFRQRQRRFGGLCSETACSRKES